MRLYVDVSETVLGGLQTGIQRVVRRIIGDALRQGPGLGIEVIPVIAWGGRLYRLRHPERHLGTAAVPTGPAATDGMAKPPAGRSPLRRLVRRSPRLVDWGYRGLWAWRRVYRRFTFSPLWPVRWLPGDILLLLDAFWLFRHRVDAAAAARTAGARLIPVVYDLIPATHPDFCDPNVVRQFNAQMPRALALADLVLGISAEVAAQVRARLASDWAPTDRRPQVASFRLGADALTVTGAEATAEAWPKGLWDGRPVFILLGTLEPRKGHAFVLEAFARRWAAGHDEVLLFIGAPGWGMTPFRRRLATAPQLGRSLFIVHGASDAALAYAMHRSRAGLVASTVEGFGLPLIECLQEGLPVLASDIPVFREVGGDLPLYFALDDPQSLADAIDRFYDLETAMRQRLRGFRWPRWDEATATLLQQLLGWQRGPEPAADGPTSG